MLLVIGVFAQNRVSERRFVLENKAQVTRDCPFSSQIGVSKSAYTTRDWGFSGPADCVYYSQTCHFAKLHFWQGELPRTHLVLACASY